MVANLMAVTAHFGPHADLATDPHGGQLPAPPAGADPQFSHTVLGDRGKSYDGIGGALYPRGFPIGMAYSAMTYLWGETEDGGVATHDQLRDVASKVFGPGMKPVWLYKGMEKGRTTWYAAWRAHNIGLDPCRAYEYPAGAAGKRLQALLVKATGGEVNDMGYQYGAEVWMPTSAKEAGQPGPAAILLEPF